MGSGTDDASKFGPFTTEQYRKMLVETGREVPCYSENDMSKLKAVASAAHALVMRGGRPGRILALARALADAGYDMGEEKEP
jgi:hypothetical protein